MNQQFLCHLLASFQGRYYTNTFIIFLNQNFRHLCLTLIQIPLKDFSLNIILTPSEILTRGRWSKHPLPAVCQPVTLMQPHFRESRHVGHVNGLALLHSATYMSINSTTPRSSLATITNGHSISRIRFIMMNEQTRVLENISLISSINVHNKQVERFTIQLGSCYDFFLIVSL